MVYSKATFGSEFIAERTATEQIMEMRLVLRYLGVPIGGPTYMFGDNKSVVDSSNVPPCKTTQEARDPILPSSQGGNCCEGKYISSS